MSTDDTTATLEAEPDVSASGDDSAARPKRSAASLGVPIQKFMFDNAIFDPPLEPTPEELAAAEASDEPPPPPPPPGVTLEELQRARQEAFAEGMAQGLAYADADAQDRTALALQHIAKIADYMLVVDQQERIGAERQIMDGVLAVAEKLAPMLHEKGSIDEIGRFAKETLQAHADERELLIAVPRGTAPRIKSELRSVMESRGLTERVKIVEDESLGPSDCRMNWADGGANRVVDRVWDAVKTGAQQALAAQGIRPISESFGQSAGDDAEAAAIDPGHLPSGFESPLPDPKPEPPAYDTPPDWLAQAIADEPSHVVRELGHAMPEPSTAQENTADSHEQVDSAGEPQAMAEHDTTTTTDITDAIPQDGPHDEGDTGEQGAKE